MVGRWVHERVGFISDLTVDLLAVQCLALAKQMQAFVTLNTCICRQANLESRAKRYREPTIYIRVWECHAFVETTRNNTD